MIVAICGGPRVGKTELSRRLVTRLGGVVVHTDDWLHEEWKEIPFKVIDAVYRVHARPLFVEGVQAARALRKGMAAD
jgi:predicted kinase